MLNKKNKTEFNKIKMKRRSLKKLKNKKTKT